MRYFCVRDCFTNNQYFRGGKFYEDYDIERGIVDKQVDGALKHFAQVSPKLLEPKEPKKIKEGEVPTEKQREKQAQYETGLARWNEVRGFIEGAIEKASKELRELRELAKKGTVRGIGIRMDSLDAMLRELRAA